MKRDKKEIIHLRIHGPTMKDPSLDFRNLVVGLIFCSIFVGCICCMYNQWYNECLSDLKTATLNLNSTKNSIIILIFLNDLCTFTITLFN